MMVVFDEISALIVFLALVHMVNTILGFITLDGDVTLQLQGRLGYVLASVMWAMVYQGMKQTRRVA